MLGADRIEDTGESFCSGWGQKEKWNVQVAANTRSWHNDQYLDYTVGNDTVASKKSPQSKAKRITFWWSKGSGKMLDVTQGSKYLTKFDLNVSFPEPMHIIALQELNGPVYLNKVPHIHSFL